VPSGGDRADFVFLTKDQLGKRYPGVSLAGLPERGGAGLVIVADRRGGGKGAGRRGVKQRGGVVVPPAEGNGTCWRSSGRNRQRQPRCIGEAGTMAKGSIGSRQRHRR
jgi:hypothetical protein